MFLPDLTGYNVHLLVCSSVQLSYPKKAYFFGMKWFSGLIIMAGFIACTNQPTPPGTPRPKLVSRDSSIKRNDALNPYVNVDVSPMDMSYFPVDYPKLPVKQPSPKARVIYSRPYRQGRKIFGQLLKYGEPWRLGANESTEIEFFSQATIQGKTVNKGRYTLYCVPHVDKWTIVFNSNLYSWGLEPQRAKDVFRFDVPIQIKGQSIEYFSMVFQPSATGADLVIAWDDVEARLPIQFTEER